MGSTTAPRTTAGQAAGRRPGDRDRVPRRPHQWNSGGRPHRPGHRSNLLSRWRPRHPRLVGRGPDPDELAWSRKAAKNANNQSVAIRVSLGKGSLLVTGDLETEAIDELLRRQQASGALDVDVYEVGHHRSANGTTEELLQGPQPRARADRRWPCLTREDVDRVGVWSSAAGGGPDVGCGDARRTAKACSRRARHRREAVQCRRMSGRQDARQLGMGMSM